MGAVVGVVGVLGRSGVRRQIAMLLVVVAWAARNAGAETQRWKARSTKMVDGSVGMQQQQQQQRRSRARVSGGGGGNRETDARGKAGTGVGIDR